jgi:hypothetical protein
MLGVPKNPLFRVAGVLAALAAAVATARLGAAERAALAAARESITASDLRRHVAVLADDAFEGREAGTRGGHAAATYLAREFERLKLKPAAGNSSYLQPFFGNCRNLLGMIEGSDPKLRNEFVIVCAHYDHVGYGNRRNSNGPIGYIHNGADDNASGVSTVLETAEAIGLLATPPRRSILFALWDSEENGLNGSKQWIQNPTVPLSAVSLAINLDMVGRLRASRLTVYGTRTSTGLRRLLCEANRDVSLALDFDWAMKDDSDHHSFYEASVPVLMFHTGLHEDYHRPSDDVERVNTEGMQQIGRLVFNSVVAAAETPLPQRFRPQGRQENEATRLAAELALEPLPSRLGVRWSRTTPSDDGVRLQWVVPGSAADRAGLRVGDHILRFAGQGVTPSRFAALVLSAAGHVTAEVQRSGESGSHNVELQLTGSPVRVGIGWRFDQAEPTVAQVIRVVPGSPAASRLRLFDRIYRVNDQNFASSNDLIRLLAGDERVTLLVEREGRMRTVELTPLKVLRSSGM